MAVLLEAGATSPSTSAFKYNDDATVPSAPVAADLGGRGGHGGEAVSVSLTSEAAQRIEVPNEMNMNITVTPIDQGILKNDPYDLGSSIRRHC